MKQKGENVRSGAFVDQLPVRATETQYFRGRIGNMGTIRSSARGLRLSTAGAA